MVDVTSFGEKDIVLFRSQSDLIDTKNLNDYKNLIFEKNSNIMLVNAHSKKNLIFPM